MVSARIGITVRHSNIDVLAVYRAVLEHIYPIPARTAVFFAITSTDMIGRISVE